MPTVKHPADSVALEVPLVSHYHSATVSAQIYLVAVLFLALLVVVRLLLTRTLPSAVTRLKTTSVRPGLAYIESAPEKEREEPSPTFGSGTRWHRPRANWPPPPHFVSGRFVGSHKLSGMDGSEGEAGQDHHPWSALSTSRGVSTSSPKPSKGPSSLTSPSSVTVSSRAGRSRSSSRASRASSGKRQSGSWDGLGGTGAKGKGKRPMGVSSGHLSDGPPSLELDQAVAGAAAAPSTDGIFHPGPDFTIPRRFSRPPPPLPLTPPTLSSSVFRFEDRRPSYAASIHPALETSFIHQPNPDYGGGPTPPTDEASSSSQSAVAVPRRRSYTKSVPIGIRKNPSSRGSASSSSGTVDPSSRSTSSTFSPSSYPPTSPLLPPPPPGHYDFPVDTSATTRRAPPLPPPPPLPSSSSLGLLPHPPAPAPAPLPAPEYKFVGGPGGPGVVLGQQEVVIDLQGEIISVMDEAGHGWKRHTRVYGGGVCLACAAAAAGAAAAAAAPGGRDGAVAGHGGFYGDKVPLEDRR